MYIHTYTYTYTYTHVYRFGCARRSTPTSTARAPETACSAGLPGAR